MRTHVRKKLRRILENIKREQGELAEQLLHVIASTRALQLWFHGAHNLTKGTGFAGDHATLYDKIYTGLAGEYDRLVERAIGVSNDETVGCPHVVAEEALRIMQRYKSPAQMDGEQIAMVALRMLEDHRHMVAATNGQVGGLDLGIDDLLASHTGQIDTYVYLVRQRTK